MIAIDGSMDQLIVPSAFRVRLKLSVSKSVLETCRQIQQGMQQTLNDF